MPYRGTVQHNNSDQVAELTKFWFINKNKPKVSMAKGQDREQR